MENSLFGVAAAVTTDIHLTDEQARDVAARWAQRAGLDLGMTSTSRDDPWLRVSGTAKAAADADPAPIVQALTEGLAAELRAVGATVAAWHLVEVLDQGEIGRRAHRSAIPPLVSTKELAEMAGLTPQRIYQYVTDQRAGKKPEFPEPVVEGFWLRSSAEHWVATRRTKPGPAPKGRESE